MIDYSKVLLVVATITLTLNLLYAFKIGVSSKNRLEKYICAKLYYLDKVADKVSITTDFVCDYLRIEANQVNTDVIEKMIYSDSFAEEYNLQKPREVVIIEASMYSKAKKREEIFFNIISFLMVTMAGLSVGLIFLNTKG